MVTWYAWKAESRPKVSSPRVIRKKPTIRETWIAPKTSAKADAKPAGDPVAESKKFLGQGVKAYKAGNYEDAAKYFKKARAKDKSNAVAARYLKMAQGKLGK